MSVVGRVMSEDGREPVTGRGSARRRESRTRLRHRLVGTAIVAAVVAALAILGAPAAQAGPGDSSASSSRFLGGSLLLGALDLDSVAQLAGTQSSNAGTPTADTDTAPLDLTALSALNVTVPGGVSLGLLPSFLQLGAVNQYSQASDDGVSRAASGAVSNAGAVDTAGGGGFPADANLSLTPILAGLPTTGVLDQLGLQLGAITGVAALTAPGPPATLCADLSAPVNCRDYTVASGTLTTRAPVVAGLVGVLVGAGGVAPTVDAAIATLTGPNGLLAQALAGLNAALAPLVGNAGLTIAITSDVTAALNAVLDAPLGDGVVTVNLRTGVISVDLDALLTSVTGNGLDELGPNTEVISGPVLAALVTRIGTLLNTVPALVSTALTAALNAAVLTVSADICLVGTGSPCTTPIVDIGTGISVSVNGTLAQVVAGTAPASLAVKVAGLPVAIPISTLLSALAGPITTALFGPGGAIATGVASTTAVVGTIITTISPVLTVLNSVVSLLANVQEPGTSPGSYREAALRLTVGDLAGAGGLATADLGRAEVGPNADLVAPTATGLTPDSGPLVGGTSVTMAGTGFASGITVVVFDSVSLTPTSVAGDGLSLTFVVPAGTVDGPVPVHASNGAGLDSADLTYTYDPPSIAASTPVDVGAASTVTGVGWPAGVSVSLQLTDSGANPVGAPVVITSTATGTFPVGTAVPVPAGSSPGTYTVVATDANGNTASDDIVAVATTPTATGLTPDSGPLVGGTSVTVTGTGFIAGTTTVVFDGASVTPTSVNAAGTSLTFVVPAGTVDGPAPVHASNGVGLDSSDLTYTYDPPAITASSPVLIGDSTDVTGAGWPAGVSVSLQLTDSGANPVGAPVVVTTTPTGEFPAGTAVPVGGTAQSLTMVATDTFGNTTSAPVVVVPLVAPVVALLDPDHGPLPGGNTVTVTGSGFIAGTTTVIFDGSPIAPDTIDPAGTSLTFTVPAGSLAGPVEVVLSNGPGSNSAPPSTYTYDPPAISATSPVFAGASTAASGSDWPASVTVSLQLETSGGTPIGGPVTLMTTAAGEFPAGVTVSVPAGTDPQTLTLVATDTFGNTASAPVQVLAPVASSLDPGHGPLIGGNTVTITGSGFIVGTTTVIVGGVPVTPDTINLAGTQLTFTVPAGTAAGQVDVVVSNGAGADSSPPLAYTYDPPAITATSPVVVGNATSATGSGWPASVSVTLQLRTSTNTPVGAPVNLVTTGAGRFPSGTSVVVPPGTDPQSLTLVATDTFGNIASAPVEVLRTAPSPAPTASGLSPDHGPLAGGTVVTIDGSGFGPDTTVTIGGIEVTPDGVNASGTSLTVTVPPGAVAGPVDVVVGNLGAEAEPLTYTYDPPTISAPNQADPGDQVPVDGDGWPADTDVTIGLQDPDGTPIGDPITVHTDPDGSLPDGTTITVPAGTAAGDLVIVATDSNGNTALSPLTIGAVTPEPYATIKYPVVQQGSTEPNQVWGFRFEPSLPVAIAVHSPVLIDLGSVIADEDGSVTTRFDVSGLTLGIYEVTLTQTRGDGSTAVATVVFVVIPIVPVLPNTGVHGVLPMSITGLALLIVGGLMLAAPAWFRRSTGRGMHRR